MREDSNFEFRIVWIDEVDGEPATTFASISIHINGTQIWPADRDLSEQVPLEWYADHLLSHLTRYWKRLALEQTYPIDIHPNNPSEAWKAAHARWNDFPREIIIEEEDKLLSFEKAHNISHAFGGIFELGCFWVLREYNCVVLDNGHSNFRVPYKVALDTLSNAGDAIAARLENKEPKKWHRIIQRWRERNHGDPLKMLTLSISLPEASIKSLLSENLLPLNDNVMEMARETEVKVAARMAGALEEKDIADIIRAVLQCKKSDSAKLDQWSDRINSLDSINSENYYFEQGIIAANALRQIMNLSDHEIADPFEILSMAGVNLFDKRMHPDVDAIACWGPNHGPAVIINSASKRLKTRKLGNIDDLRKSAQARVTAAHELCHLLLDRNHMIATVEVLGGRTPPSIEKRARAFAPALLLPKSQARAAWDDAGQPTEQKQLESVIRTLCKKFKVTKMVAAWKLEHGIAEEQKLPEVRAALNRILPSRVERLN